MPPTYDFSQTRNQIILRALRIIGVVAEGNDATSEQLVEGAQALESLVKWLQAEGTQLWSVEDRTLLVIAGTQDYTLGTDILSIDNFVIRDSSNYETKVALVTDEIWKATYTPTDTGRPIRAKVDMRTAEVNTISLYPKPDINYTGRYSCIRKLSDFDTAVGTPEMPQRWFDPLVYTLASNLADEHQLPLAERAYLSQKAKAMRDVAGKLDMEPADTLFMRPT